MSGISFQFLQPGSTCFELIRNQNNDFNYPGFYFIHAKLKDKFSGNYVTIYCGQSSTSVKRRLEDHWNKFNTNGHDWNTWYKKHENIIEKLYFSSFETDYGPAYENFMIYFKAVEILFNLNTTLNGHSNLIDIDKVNYNKHPFIGTVVFSMIKGGDINNMVNNVAFMIKNILN